LHSAPGMSISVIQIHRFHAAILAEGRRWTVYALGGRRDDDRWIGWFEFEDASGEARATGRETTQPSFDALVYWATGIEPVYLEGAFTRAVAVPAPGAPPTGERLVA